MPTFYDPITNDPEHEIDADVFFYLVRTYKHPELSENNTFRIQGITANPEQLPSDPVTQAMEYWPIPTAQLLACLSNEANKSRLFVDDKLISAPLSLQDIRECFKFNPNGIRPHRFNETVRRELYNLWATNILEGNAPNRLGVGYASKQQVEQLVIASHGYFSEENAEDMEGFLSYTITRATEFCGVLQVHNLLDIQYFSQDILLSLTFEHENIRELLTEACVAALQDHTISGEDLYRMRTREKRLLLIHPNCLQALRNHQTSIAVLQELSAADLSEAISHNHFIMPTQNTLLK